MAAYVFYWQGEEGRNVASRKLGAALVQINSDFSKMQIANRDFANKLSRDSVLIDAINKNDRSSISSLFKGASDARGFSGVLTVYDENGKVIYSSDTPAKFGYSLRGKNNAVDYVFNNQDNFIGPTYGLTAAQSIALSALVPIIASNGQCAGLVAVSEPIDEQFLTGEAMKFALLSEPLTGVDLILLGVRDRSQVYATPGLLRERPNYLRILSDQGVKALPNWQEPGSWQMGNMFSWLTNLFNRNANVPGLAAGFVKDGQFWQPYNLLAAASGGGARGFANGTEIVGVILAVTPIFSQGIKPTYVMLASCIMGLAAIFSIVALSTQLNDQPDGPVLTLTERLNKWRTDKRLPPNVKLTGPWRDLSELIDQTLIEWQSTIQALKVQLNKTSSTQIPAIQPEQSQANDQQFEALNRQLTNQGRQLSEFSRQLNHANQQAVFLQHELEAILQSTTEGILILDQYGNIIHANNIFSNWIGKSEGEIAGRFCLDLVKRSDENSGDSDSNASRPFVKHEANASALTEKFFPEGIIHNAQSNTAIEISMNLQPVTSHDNRVTGYILVARDKSLRTEIAGLKMEIVTMLARAIRGPLILAEKEWQNVLASQNELLKEVLDKTPPQQLTTNVPEEVHIQLNRELNQELKMPELTFAQKLANLHSRYKSLVASVENMLTTHGQSIGQLIPLTDESGLLKAIDIDSVWGTAEPVKESFVLAKLVGECLQETANLAREKQLLLDYKTSTALPSITADRALTKSILSPIVEKIISITAPGGKVRVESSLKGKEIQLSVSSSGPALYEDETADMFAGFDQEKHEEESYGSRLALYLARNNAERIGAKVWAQSETHDIDSGESGQSASQGTTAYIVFSLA